MDNNNFHVVTNNAIAYSFDSVVVNSLLLKLTWYCYH